MVAVGVNVVLSTVPAGSVSRTLTSKAVESPLFGTVTTYCRTSPAAAGAVAVLPVVTLATVFTAGAVADTSGSTTVIVTVLLVGLVSRTAPPSVWLYV